MPNCEHVECIASAVITQLLAGCTGDLQVRAHAEYTQMRSADRLMYTNTATHSRMINMYKSKKRKQVVRGTRVNHIIKNRQDKETHANMLYAHIARYC